MGFFEKMDCPKEMDFNEVDQAFRIVCCTQTEYNSKKVIKLPNTAGSFYELHG